jgi:ribosomal protein S6
MFFTIQSIFYFKFIVSSTILIHNKKSKMKHSSYNIKKVKMMLYIILTFLITNNQVTFLNAILHVNKSVLLTVQ